MNASSDSVDSFATMESLRGNRSTAASEQVGMNGPGMSSNTEDDEDVFVWFENGKTTDGKNK